MSSWLLSNPTKFSILDATGSQNSTTYKSNKRQVPKNLSPGRGDYDLALNSSLSYIYSFSYLSAYFCLDYFSNYT